MARSLSVTTRERGAEAALEGLIGRAVSAGAVPSRLGDGVARIGKRRQLRPSSDRPDRPRG